MSGRRPTMANLVHICPRGVFQQIGEIFIFISLQTLIIISFKLALMHYKCLHGLAPSYLADVCTAVSSVVGRWQLRSVNSRTLVVPGTRTTIGRRNFVVSGPATWNRLPVELRTSSLSIDTFAKKLKAHLFSCEHL